MQQASQGLSVGPPRKKSLRSEEAVWNRAPMLIPLCGGTKAKRRPWCWLAFPTVAGISPGQGFLSFLGQEKATQGGTNKQAAWAPFSALDWGCAVIGSLSPALPSSKWQG